MNYANFFASPRFDYYRATFDTKDITGFDLPTWEDCVYSVVDEFPLAIPQADAIPVNRRAEKGLTFTLDGQPLFRLCWGGSTFGDRIHWQASGNKAPFLASFLASRFKNQYSCSRVDVAYDSVHPGIFMFCTGLMREFALDQKINCRTDGDWLTGDALNKGRTLYLGRPEKTRDRPFVRLYEKGKEGHTNCLEWVRLEVEFNASKKADKRKLALLTPHQVAFASPWISSLMMAIGFKPSEPIQKIATVWQTPDNVRSLIHAAIQYKRVWRDLAESLADGESSIGKLLLDIADLHGEIGKLKSGINPTGLVNESLPTSKNLGITSDPYLQLIEKHSRVA